MYYCIFREWCPDPSLFSKSAEDMVLADSIGNRKCSQGRVPTEFVLASMTNSETHTCLQAKRNWLHRYTHKS
jgi:hypothetical protein